MRYDVNFNTVIEAHSTTQALDRAATLAGQLEYNEFATLSGVNVNEHWKESGLTSLGDAEEKPEASVGEGK